MARRMSFLSSKVAWIIAEWNCVVVTTLQTKTTKLTSVALFETDNEKCTFKPVMAFSIQHSQITYYSTSPSGGRMGCSPLITVRGPCLHQGCLDGVRLKSRSSRSSTVRPRTRRARISRTSASWSPRRFPCNTTSSLSCSRGSGHFLHPLWFFGRRLLEASK